MEFYVWSNGQMYGPFKKDGELSKQSRLNLGPVIERSKLSKNSLAKRIGVYPQQINMWIRGERNPSMKYLQKMAKALGVSLGKLFTNELEP